MKKAKRIVGLLTVVVMLFSLFCTTGYAFGGDVALRSLEFLVNGNTYGTPSDGDKINVKVKFDNTTTSAVQRTIILASYDADENLIDMTSEDKNVSVGTSDYSGEAISYTADTTVVRAFVLENTAGVVPVYTRTFTATRDENGGIFGVWITVGENEREGTVDNINKTLTVEVPDYDENGDAVALGEHGIKIKARESCKVVDDDGGAWSIKDNYYYYKVLDLSNGGCNVFLENTRSGDVETYRLVVCRTVEEDFETFSGEFKGNESAATKDTIEQGTYTGTWKIGESIDSGRQRKMWFTAMASPNTKNDIAADEETGTEAYSYTDAMEIKAVVASEVKTLDDSTKVLNSGITNAAGKVMMINKPSNGNSATGTANYGTAELRVGTSTRMAEAQNATKLTFEYDAAYGTNLNDATHGGRVGGLTAGAYIYGGNSTYTANGGKVIARLSGHNAVLNDSARFQYQAGKQALDTAQLSTEDMSQWRRVKVEFTRPSADSDDITVKTYYDGVLQSKEYNSKETEEEGATNWAWPTQLVFRTASNRSCQMYIDNLKITWDRPGDYTATPQMFKSLKIDKYEGVLSGDTITVDIPIYDADGAALNIDPAWTTTVEVKDADTTVAVGDTALTGDGKSKTAAIDYTNGGYNMKIGEDTYKLVINRYISETFNSGFSGEVTAATNTISVSGTERSGWFGFTLNKATDDAYNTDKKISFINHSDVKKIDNAEETMPIGNAGAHGNVLALVNPKNGNTNSTADNYGYVGMTVANAEKLNEYGADDATTMSFEYDVAYGNPDDTASAGRVSAFMSGLWAWSGGNTVARTGGSNDNAIKTEGKHQYQAGADAVGTSKAASADMSQWRHVKVEFTRESAGSDTAAIAVYYDGVKQSTTWNDSACKWPNKFEIRTAQNRACKMYVDNVKLSWNTEGEYRNTYLDSFTVMGVGGTTIDNAEISKDTVTVTLPLYNTDGSTFGTDCYVGASVGGVQTVATVYTSSEDTTGTQLAEMSSVNFGNIGEGAKIVVGDTTYALKLRRQLFDNFDDKTLFKGATAASVTDAGVMSFVAATADRNLIGADGETAITGKDDFSSAISVGCNQQWKFATDGTDSDKVTAVANSVDIGLADLSNAVFNNNEKSFASGNALRVAKRVAYTDSKDTSAPYIEIKVNCNDSKSAVYEFDLGFDYSKCTMGTDYSVGSNSAGIRILNNNTQLVQVVGSQNGLTQDKRSEGKLNGSNYTLDKFHHIKVEFANGTYSLYIDDMKTAVSSGTADNMPNCFRIFTSTLRACEIYVDNLDISYSVN